MNVRLLQNKSRRANPRKGARQAYFPEQGRYIDTVVYDRYALNPGMQFEGPAIVEERESTLIIGTRCHARLDESLDIIVGFTDEK
jgi:N-methylhydantoinase A